MDNFVLTIAAIIFIGSSAFAYGLLLSALTYFTKTDDHELAFLSGYGIGDSHVFVGLALSPLIILSCMTGFFQLKTRKSGMFWPANILGALGYVIVSLILVKTIIYGSA